MSQDAPSPDVAGLIEHMVDRFLGWRLPDNFSPDAGISFKRGYSENPPWPAIWAPMPTGTNLFDATQAAEMVRYMIDDEALSCLTPPKQDGARDSTVGAEPEAWRLFDGPVGGWLIWHDREDAPDEAEPLYTADALALCPCRCTGGSGGCVG